jgi:hypothetical protein
MMKVNEQHKKGLIIGALIYTIGALITLIVHFFTGWEYAHAPPPSFVFVVLTIFIGIARLIKNITYISSKGRFE